MPEVQEKEVSGIGKAQKTTRGMHSLGGQGRLHIHLRTEGRYDAGTEEHCSRRCDWRRMGATKLPTASSFHVRSTKYL